MSERLALKTQETNDLKIYSQEEVLKSAIEYFKGDTLAGEVWMKKYALKDAMGNLYEKSPDEMHRRLASEFARIEAKYPNPISEEEIRSEERRVGKECRYRWSTDQQKKKR